MLQTRVLDQSPGDGADVSALGNYFCHQISMARRNSASWHYDSASSPVLSLLVLMLGSIYVSAHPLV